LISDGGWNTSDPVTIGVGSAAVPVSKMLPVGDTLWCSCHNTVKVFDTVALQFQVSETRPTRVHCTVRMGRMGQFFIFFYILI